MSKRKLTVPKRNPFVVLALKKTGAGSHRKTNKALRKRERQRGYSSDGQSKKLLTSRSRVRISVPAPCHYIEAHSGLRSGRYLRSKNGVTSECASIW